jgi:adenosylmethionine-8-amino-7-oxononanoate aminotransferase
MAALELVSDRDRKSAASKDAVAKVYETAYDEGVMVRTSGNNVIISPPLVVTAKDVGRILAALDAGLSAAEGK